MLLLTRDFEMQNGNLLYIQLAGVLGLSSLFGYLVRFLKLPLIVAYLLVGVVFSLSGLLGIVHSEVLIAFSEIGIAMVLFFIGMGMDVRELKALGRPLIITSFVQIALSVSLGWGIGRLMGFGPVESGFIGLTLAFSSTIVVVKLLIEKRDMSSLYGKLSIGILLIEDLVALGVLMAMTVGSSFAHAGFQESFPVLAIIFKGTALLLLTFVLSRYILRRIFRAVATSPELLFLTALSWCFVYVAISLLLGFSVVIGAFLAGLALASSPFYYEIQGKVKPLRDFFVMLFFVYLGSQVVVSQIVSVVPLIVFLVVYAVLVKPLIFATVLGGLGFRKHTVFQTATNLSQVSEFSLIIMVIGVRVGYVSSATLTAVAVTVVLSVLVSSILIANSRKVYKKSGWFLNFFERKGFTHQLEMKQKLDGLTDHVIVVGAHRMGGEIVRFLQREKIPFMVLDFNPRVIQNLVNEGILAIYGDVGDPEIVEFLNLDRARFVISTVPNFEDNLIFLKEIRRQKVEAYTILRAASPEDAKRLYKMHADYVVLPELVSGEYVVGVLKDHWGDSEFFRSRADVELKRLFRNKFVLL
ncbi:MAG: Sodium/hydrogen exchanger [Candidatus Gottesmanbacteria bacterium GW2011_GWA1_47_8]|uniref:Sodium/hydrogen exchanger n=2 Tax=Microgenomates group TaxID=1794810 RepID=A0A0G1TGG2_9BACT|nr:MAG: Sodium/hydrogen exchanger [Candidatus Gottesmanbacteria bacterium GW2011_GWA1_47_8]